MKTITSRANELKRACTAVHGLVVHGHAIAKGLRAAVIMLIGIAVLYGAWRPFVQAASINVQFTAAVAVADCILQEPR